MTAWGIVAICATALIVEGACLLVAFGLCRMAAKPAPKPPSRETSDPPRYGPRGV